MKARFGMSRGKALAFAALAAIAASTLTASEYALAADDRDRSDYWGVITRNTIGSPVADLRQSSFGSFGVQGPYARPPYGRGGLGIEVADRSTSLTPPGEKVDFDDEVDFFGDSGLDLEQLGFHVFQTRENVDDYGGPRDMPDIRFEIDPNLAARPNDNYSTMVWVPDAVSTANLNRWSPFDDATSTGDWYLTGSETNCTQANPCSSEELKDTLDDGGEAPSIYTAAVGKGRDHMWTGAVDDFRIDQHIYDFEADGVRARPAPRAN